MKNSPVEMMQYAKNHYKPRLIDAQVEKRLRLFGAISIEGPKWCGKTWVGYQFANSVVSMVDSNTRRLAEIDTMNVLSGEPPLLVDEWNLVPKLWDATRYACDFLPGKGNFILTCSTKLSDDNKRQILHSGAGRIDRLNIHTMSLYETGDSTGVASIAAMLDGTQESTSSSVASLGQLADYIIRGGWPANLDVPPADYGIIPASYIKALLENDELDDFYEDRAFPGALGSRRALMLLRSLARNESTIAGNQTLVRDIADNERGDDTLLERHAVAASLDVLNRLHLLEDQPAFNINYRSSDRIGKTSKHHFADPSLAAALLHLSRDKLIADLHIFGILFEALAVHDLRVYAESLNGQIYHFRDNSTGDEVDAIIELPDGEYIAIEIKLGFDHYDEARDSLAKFYHSVEKKPKLMLVIVGAGMGGITYDADAGVYIASLTALKP